MAFDPDKWLENNSVDTAPTTPPQPEKPAFDPSAWLAKNQEVSQPEAQPATPAFDPDAWLSKNAAPEAPTTPVDKSTLDAFVKRTDPKGAFKMPVKQQEPVAATPTAPSQPDWRTQEPVKRGTLGELPGAVADVVTKDTYVGQTALALSAQAIDFFPAMLSGARANVRGALTKVFGERGADIIGKVANFTPGAAIVGNNKTLDNMLDASGRLRADTRQQLMDAAYEKGGKTGAVVSSLVDGIEQTLANLKTFKALNIGYGDAAGATKWMKALNSVKGALVRSGVMTSTQKQASVKDAITSFALSTLYQSTPAVSGWMNSRMGAVAADIALNLSLSSAQMNGIIETANQQAVAEGQPDKSGMYAAIALAQMFGSDVVFGAMSKSFSDAPRPVKEALLKAEAESRKAIAKNVDAGNVAAGDTGVVHGPARVDESILPGAAGYRSAEQRALDMVRAQQGTPGQLAAQEGQVLARNLVGGEGVAKPSPANVPMSQTISPSVEGALDREVRLAQMANQRAGTIDRLKDNAAFDAEGREGVERVRAFNEKYGRTQAGEPPQPPPPGGFTPSSQRGQPATAHLTSFDQLDPARFQATTPPAAEAARTPAPAAAPEAKPQTPAKTVGFVPKSKRMTQAQYSEAGGSPVIDAIADLGGLVGKMHVRNTGKAGEYDASINPKEAGGYGSTLYRKKGIQVDVAAQRLYEDGKISAPTADAMWEAVRAEIAGFKSGKNPTVEPSNDEADYRQYLAEQSDELAATVEGARGAPQEVDMAGSQPKPASPIRGTDPRTRQTEFLGQEEGGFRLTGQQGIDQQRVLAERDAQQAAAREAEARQGTLPVEQPAPDLATMKMPELKAAAKKAGVDPNGNKDAIIKRITAKQKLMGVLESVEQAARADLDQLRKGGTLGMNKPLGMAADYAIIGAVKIAKGTVKFAEWSKAMLDEFGDGIKPYLRQIYANSTKIAKSGIDDPAKIRSIAESGSTEIAEKIGKRNLSLMSTDESVRQMFVNQDARMEAEGYPKPETFEQWDRQADEKIAAMGGGNAAYQSLVANKLDPADAVQQRMAMKVISEQGAEDIHSGDVSRIERAVVAANNIRRGGTDVARALVARRDPNENPLERTKKLLNNLLVLPSEKESRAMDSANVPKRMAEIRRVAAQTKKILDALRAKGFDINKLTAEDVADRRKMATAMRIIQNEKSSWSDVEMEFWRNSILSFFPTQVANVVGNVSNQVYTYAMLRPMEAVINSMIGGGKRGGVTGADLKSMYEGLFSGGTWYQSFRNALDAWSTEHPASGSGSRVDERGTAIKGFKGRVIRSPQRSLLATDEFSKTLIVQSEIAARASMLGRKNGLSGEDLSAFVAKEVSDPSSQSWADARTVAEDITFQTKPGAIGKELLSLRNSDGLTGWIARHLVPFVTTPSNIVKTGIRRTPLGALVLPHTIYKAVKGEGSHAKAVERAAEQVIAFGFMAVLKSMIENDLVTGSTERGPQRGKRDLQYRTAPPLSFRLPGGEWVSYARIEPLATSTAMMVDMMQNDGSSVSERTWKAMNGVVRDKTYMKSIGDVLEMIDSGEPNKVGNWASDFASSYMPNVVRGTLRATDPYIRSYMVNDPDNYWRDWIKSTGYKALPLAAFAPQPKVDLYGRDIKKGSLGRGPVTDAIYRATIPIAVQQQPSIVNIDRMLMNWNRDNPDLTWWPTLPGTSVSIRGKQRRLSETEYHTFLKLRGEAAVQDPRTKTLNFGNPQKKDIDRAKDIFSDATTKAKVKMGLAVDPRLSVAKPNLNGL